jgi:hypothetical protein
VVNIEVRREERNRKAPMQSYRLTVDAEGPRLQKWVLSNGEERRKLASFSAENGDVDRHGVEVALDQIFEFRIPFDLIGAHEGTRIRLRFAIWREHLPLDSLPLEGWIDLFALPEAELECHQYGFSPNSIQ